MDGLELRDHAAERPGAKSPAAPALLTSRPHRSCRPHLSAITLPLWQRASGIPVHQPTPTPAAAHPHMPSARFPPAQMTAKQPNHFAASATPVPSLSAYTHLLRYAGPDASAAHTSRSARMTAMPRLPALAATAKLPPRSLPGWPHCLSPATPTVARHRSFLIASPQAAQSRRRQRRERGHPSWLAMQLDQRMHVKVRHCPRDHREQSHAPDRCPPKPSIRLPAH